MKRSFLILLAVSLIVPMVLVGNGQSASKDKTYTLVYSDFRTQHAFTVKGGVVPWAEAIQKATGGRVKFEMHPNGTLGSAGDHYEMVYTGVCDVAGPMTENSPGRFPLYEMNKLPMLFPSGEVAALVLSDLVDKYMVDTEFKDVKVLWIQATPNLQLQLRNKPVKTKEDLKGLKINCDSRVVADTLMALGAVPATMYTPEIYPSLERGVIDGSIFGWEGAIAFKLQEVTRYRTEVNLCVMSWPIMMNLKTWNSLPADIQQIIEDLSGRERSRIAAAAFEQTEAHLKGLIAGMDKKAGKPGPYTLTKEERARWLKAVQPLWYRWAEEKDAKGLPGTKVLEDALRLIEKYSNKGS